MTGDRPHTDREHPRRRRWVRPVALLLGIALALPLGGVPASAAVPFTVRADLGTKCVAGADGWYRATLRPAVSGPGDSDQVAVYCQSVRGDVAALIPAP
ncbi:MAG: hypothetical protein ACKOTZ_03705 [Chloroflexota bacterium]